MDESDARPDPAGLFRARRIQFEAETERIRAWAVALRAFPPYPEDDPRTEARDKIAEALGRYAEADSGLHTEG